MAARDHREGAIAHREGPDDRQPGEQRILRGDRREDPLEREDDDRGANEGKGTLADGLRFDRNPLRETLGVPRRSRTLARAPPRGECGCFSAFLGVYHSLWC